jgi:hypothetical protein
VITGETPEPRRSNRGHLRAPDDFSDLAGSEIREGGSDMEDPR